MALHCSHYFGRSNWRTRCEPANAMALCYGCHQFVGSNPSEHHELWNKRFTKKERDKVIALRNKLNFKTRDVKNSETTRKFKRLLAELENA